MLYFPPFHHRNKGFTLTELLIGLAILGIVATFTIPKILATQQNSQKVALAKEAISSVAAAYQMLILKSGVSINTKIADVQPYLNYVAIDTTSQLDDRVGANGMYDCSSGTTCLRMHGGGTLYWPMYGSFNTTNPLQVVYFFYDPDSMRTGIAGDAPGKAVCFTLYMSGRITTLGNVDPGSIIPSGEVFNPGAWDPTWYKWQ